MAARRTEACRQQDRWSSSLSQCGQPVLRQRSRTDHTSSPAEAPPNETRLKEYSEILRLADRRSLYGDESSHLKSSAASERLTPTNLFTDLTTQMSTAR